MYARDIPWTAQYARKTVGMGDLLERAAGPARANWTDLLDVSGIYVVTWTAGAPVQFTAGSDRARSAVPLGLATLKAKWDRIIGEAPTDILYIGKGDNVKRRVRQLARFGVGRANNHKGGEWLWQVREIDRASVLMQSCPDGCQIGFENWLLEAFREVHGEYPLANRDGPEGSARWCPQPTHRLVTEK